MIYASLALLITSVIFIACSQQEIQNSEKRVSLKVEGMIMFDTKTHKITSQEFKSDREKNNAMTLKNGKHEDFHILRTTFTAKNKSSITAKSKSSKIAVVPLSVSDGFYEMYLDEDLIYSVEVANGIIITEDVPESAAYLSRPYPCTFQGIKSCAIKRIHSQDWSDMYLCVASGFDCVVHYYATCAIDLC